MLNFLNGYKTYMGVIAYGVYHIAIAMFPKLGMMMSPDIVDAVLATWTGIAFRDAIAAKK